MNQSTEEAWRRDPQPSFQRPRGDSRVEEKRRGSCPFRGPSRHTRTLRTPWLVLPRIKDISPRKRVTCDKNGGSHGRDRQVREILSPGLRSRRIRRNGKEAVRGSTRGTEGTPGHS